MTEAKLASLAGCSLAYVKQLKQRKAAQLGEAFAVKLATETGVDVGWLRGQYRMRPILARYRVPWTPAVFQAIQAAKMNPQSIAAETTLLKRHWLISCDRLGEILAAGMKRKQTVLVLDRLHLALEQIALEFGASETLQASIDRSTAILIRYRQGKRVPQLAAIVGRRVQRAINAAAKTRPTKRG